MGELSLFQNKAKKTPNPPKNNVENDPRYNQYSRQSLEELMDYLVTYGKHTVSWMCDGWYCGLEFYVNVIGAELKVRSDFDCTTHKNAVIQCIIRMHETIDQINNTRNAK